jgi:hypothetical protein
MNHEENLNLANRSPGSSQELHGVKKTRGLFHRSAPEASHKNPLQTATYPYHCHYIYTSTHCSRFPVELERGFHFLIACHIPRSVLSLQSKATCYAISTQIYVSHPSNANFSLLRLPWHNLLHSAVTLCRISRFVSLLFTLSFVHRRQWISWNEGRKAYIMKLWH